MNLLYTGGAIALAFLIGMASGAHLRGRICAAEKAAAMAAHLQRDIREEKAAEDDASKRAAALDRQLKDLREKYAKAPDRRCALTADDFR